MSPEGHRESQEVSSKTDLAAAAFSAAGIFNHPKLEIANIKLRSRDSRFAAVFSPDLRLEQIADSILVLLANDRISSESVRLLAAMALINKFIICQEAATSEITPKVDENSAYKFPDFNECKYFIQRTGSEDLLFNHSVLKTLFIQTAADCSVPSVMGKLGFEPNSMQEWYEFLRLDASSFHNHDGQRLMANLSAIWMKSDPMLRVQALKCGLCDEFKESFRAAAEIWHTEILNYELLVAEINRDSVKTNKDYQEVGFLFEPELLRNVISRYVLELRIGDLHDESLARLTSFTQRFDISPAFLVKIFNAFIQTEEELRSEVDIEFLEFVSTVHRKLISGVAADAKIETFKCLEDFNFQLAAADALTESLTKIDSEVGNIVFEPLAELVEKDPNPYSYGRYAAFLVPESLNNLVCDFGLSDSFVREAAYKAIQRLFEDRRSCARNSVMNELTEQRADLLRRIFKITDSSFVQARQQFVLLPDEIILSNMLTELERFKGISDPKIFSSEFAELKKLTSTVLGRFQTLNDSDYALAFEGEHRQSYCIANLAFVAAVSIFTYKEDAASYVYRTVLPLAVKGGLKAADLKDISIFAATIAKSLVDSSFGNKSVKLKNLNAFELEFGVSHQDRMAKGLAELKKIAHM